MDSTHDTCVFLSSALPALVEIGYFTPGVSALQLGKVMVLPLLIGDLTHLLLPWLVQPFTGQLDPTSHISTSAYVLHNICDAQVVLFHKAWTEELQQVEDALYRECQLWQQQQQ